MNINEQAAQMLRDMADALERGKNIKSCPDLDKLEFHNYLASLKHMVKKMVMSGNTQGEVVLKQETEPYQEEHDYHGFDSHVGRVELPDGNDFEVVSSEEIIGSFSIITSDLKKYKISIDGYSRK